MPIVVTQYIMADTNVVVIKDKNVSLILSDSNICMILNVNKNLLWNYTEGFLILAKRENG